jgi:hypothetical protein
VPAHVLRLEILAPTLQKKRDFSVCQVCAPSVLAWNFHYSLRSDLTLCEYEKAFSFSLQFSTLFSSAFSTSFSRLFLPGWRRVELTAQFFKNMDNAFQHYG